MSEIAEQTVQISLEDGSVQEERVGIRVDQVIKATHAPNGLGYVGALVNNDVVSLSFSIEVNSTVIPITMENHHGDRIYRRSVAFLLAKVIRELHPHATFRVENSLGTGLYCTFEQDGDMGIEPDQLATVENRMRELVEQDLPIVRRKNSFAVAVQRFKEQKQWDKYNLLRFRNPPMIVMYSCENFSDLAHGVMASNTGLLSTFKLINYEPGFVIQFPERDNLTTLASFEKQPQLFNIFQEHKRWGRILGVSTVGQLNELIASGEIYDFTKIVEALHEKKIAQIADQIYQRRDHTKFILIAGPSSAGKTTLSKRLMVQLRVNGLRPITISIDNYFVNRDATPLDENGNYDFEHIEAIDLALFNAHLQKLDQGEEIEIPRFNFEKGQREYRGKTIRLDLDNILILEGIHGLNPRLTEALPDKHKFKIYTSALGQLNLDQHNRISTTDNRLLRRLVRDHTFRGHSARMTLQMWPSVLRGEKRWIFPNQQHANIAFNSALEYEMSVLKPLAEPLLAEVKPYEQEYATARRLMEFLDYFLVISEEHVPAGSILREYIGNSSFTY